MNTYSYNRTTTPDWGVLSTNIASSGMSDKSYLGGKFEKSTDTMGVIFESSLDTADIEILDSIVSSCPVYTANTSPDPVYLKAPDETLYHLTVDESGILVTEEVQ